MKDFLIFCTVASAIALISAYHAEEEGFETSSNRELNFQMAHVAFGAMAGVATVLISKYAKN